MNPRDLLKVVLVFALLLMTVTVAAAQEEPPVIAPAQEEPAPVEPAAVPKGESASPAANLTESEPNNGFIGADTMALGDVIAGAIGYAGDVDTFIVDVGMYTTNALIDVDAQMNGSPLDAAICLYDREHTLLACSDNSNGADPLIFKELNSRNTTPGAPHYIQVRSARPADGSGAFSYRLAVYRPLLVSAAVGGVAAGVPFQKTDVLAHYDFADGTEKWMLFFDASDVGITRNVMAIAAGNHADLSLTLQSPQMLSIYDWNDGLTIPRMVTPYDVLGFQGCDARDPDGPCGQFGPTTAGHFYIDYRGADYGLTLASEKIDALVLPWWVSTIAETIFASGVKVADEDVSNLPYGELYFDGSQVPGLQIEDVYAADAHWTGSSSQYLLTILGTGRIGGTAFTQKDIFMVDAATYQLNGLYWRASAHHFNYNLDAFDAVD